MPEPNPKAPQPIIRPDFKGLAVKEKPKEEMVELPKSALDAKLSAVSESAKEEGKKIALQDLQTASHTQAFEAKERESLLASQSVPKKRGRPKKAAKEDPFAFSSPKLYSQKPAPKPALPKLANLVAASAPNSENWTDKGKAAKRRAMALIQRLPEKFAQVQPPMVDSDEAWTEFYYKDLKGLLASADNELTMAELYFMVLGKVSEMGVTRGYRLEGLPKHAMQNYAEIRTELVELSIEYDSFLSTNPILRLLGKTARMATQVHHGIDLQTPATPATQDKFADL